MTVPVERTAPAVRAALADHAPDDREQFEVEFRTALAETDDDFDLTRVVAVVDRWWARAYVLANPDPVADDEAARVLAGDWSHVTVEWRAQPDGTNHVYRRAPDGDWVFSHVQAMESTDV